MFMNLGINIVKMPILPKAIDSMQSIKIVMTFSIETEKKQP